MALRKRLRAQIACPERLGLYNMFERSMVAARVARLIGYVDRLGYKALNVGSG